ncbi:hypothetical protein TcCL_NonESM02441 [Trypanosoma cruzi]|nr:hypothetical protein TcCL_NonESM02441 [Trypanosoma cruzi]
MSSGVRHISDIDRSILSYCGRVDGATSIAIKKAAQLFSLVGCSCARPKTLKIAPLGTFAAPTLTAPTSLEPPLSLSSHSCLKSRIPVIRRTTVESRLRISSVAPSRPLRQAM